MKKIIIPLLLIPGALIGQSSRDPQIDTMAIRAYTRFLSDDALRGRATGAPELEIAARYLRAACEQLQLTSVGPSFLLPVHLRETRVVEAGTSMEITSGDGTLAFSTPGDFVLNVGRFDEHQTLVGPAVLVGDDSTVGMDSTPAPTPSAIAVVETVLRPDLAARLVERGFAAAIYLTPDAEVFDLYRRSRGSTRLAHADPSVESSFLPHIPTIIASPRIVGALARSAEWSDGRVTRLNAQITIRIETEATSLTSHNVGCMLRGQDTSRTRAIVYTAHYDHLGVSQPDAVGDSIYNGFSDDAAGVAMLLAIAEAFRERPSLHPVLFLFFTGEERGLLGSDAFVHESPWPLEDIAGVINLDAGAPPALPTSWRIAGGVDSRLGTLATDVAERRGWSASTSGATPNSDYYPFWRRGVPSVFLVPGTEPYEGLTGESSTALKKRWDRYHEAGDEWSADFPFAGLERYALYAWLVGRELDKTDP